jgi:protein-disulfide isomerase
LEELGKQYGSDIRFVYKHLVVHDVARLPALATCAAGEQGKFWEFEHAVWQNGWDFASETPRLKSRDTLNQESMEKLATGLGLDLAKFKTDLAGPKCADVLKSSAQLMSQLGVNGTPGFFINGRFIGGAVPIDQFRAVIDDELKKANAAIASQGVKPGEYYQKVVVEKGKKSI